MRVFHYLLPTRTQEPFFLGCYNPGTPFTGEEAEEASHKFTVDGVGEGGLRFVSA